MPRTRYGRPSATNCRLAIRTSGSGGPFEASTLGGIEHISRNSAVKPGNRKDMMGFVSVQQSERGTKQELARKQEPTGQIQELRQVHDRHGQEAEPERRLGKENGIDSGSHHAVGRNPGAPL